MRELAGTIVKDLPRYVGALAQRRAYLRLCNRDEQLETAPQGQGVRCMWRWTSDLHAPKQIPALGTWLMHRALLDHPVRLAAAPRSEAAPQVSFIIGHRGEARLPLLLATLASIAAQEGIAAECIVVQQEAGASLAARLPAWVKVVQTPPPQPSLPFCRSWAFNIGVRHARGSVVVLHDNDMLVPIDYAATAVARLSQGYDVANLKRFVFYLGASDSTRTLGGDIVTAKAPEHIVQNLEAGGSVVIDRDAFERIGGMDESFVGWGGEDNEFWERAGLLRAWHWGELPLVHLWHAPQPGKHAAANETALRYRELTEIPPQERVRVLSARPRGLPSGPIKVDESREEVSSDALEPRAGHPRGAT